jgi:hypothetical protein
MAAAADSAARIAGSFDSLRGWAASGFVREAVAAAPGKWSKDLQNREGFIASASLSVGESVTMAVR